MYCVTETVIVGPAQSNSGVMDKRLSRVMDTALETTPPETRRQKETKG